MSGGLVWVVCKLCNTKRPVEKMQPVSETTTVNEGAPKVVKSWACADGVWCAGQAAKKGVAP